MSVRLEDDLSQSRLVKRAKEIDKLSKSRTPDLTVVNSRRPPARTPSTTSKEVPRLLKQTTKRTGQNSEIKELIAAVKQLVNKEPGKLVEETTVYIPPEVGEIETHVKAETTEQANTVDSALARLKRLRGDKNDETKTNA